MRESPMGMSQIGLYQQCPRRWAFKYLLGWLENTDVTPEPLIYGQAIHEGKEEFYRTGSLKSAKLKTDNYLRSVPMPDDMFLRCIDKARSLWDEWYKAYGAEDLKKYHIIGIEKAGWLELPNGVRVSIRIDLLVRDKKTGHIFIIDTKTTKGTLHNMLSSYYYKAQPRLYCSWLLREEPSMRQHFRGWITDVASQRILKSGIVTQCQRSEPVIFDEEQIQDGLISLALITDEIKDRVNKVVNHSTPISYTFNCNYDNCKSFNRLCPYFSECSTKHQFDDSVPPKFKLDPWVAERTVIKEYL